MKTIIFTIFILCFSNSFSQEIIKSYVTINGKMTEISRINAFGQVDVSCLDKQNDLWEPARKIKKTLKTLRYTVQETDAIEDFDTKNEYIFYQNKDKSELVLGLIDSTVLHLNKPGSLQLDVWVNNQPFQIIGFSLYVITSEVNYVEVRRSTIEKDSDNPLKKMHIVFDKLNVRKNDQMVIRDILFQNPFTLEKNILKGDFLILLQ